MNCFLSLIAGVVIVNIGTVVYTAIKHHQRARYEAYLRILDYYAKKEWFVYIHHKNKREDELWVRYRGRRLPDQVALGVKQ